MRSSILLTRIVPFLIIILLAVHTTAVPPLPAEFYGSVLIGGNPAPAGTIIAAQINGVEKGAISTDIPGFYGGPGLFDNRLKVNVSEEEYRPGEMKIVFMINGQQASPDADYEAGSSRQLDLSTGAGVPESQPTSDISSNNSIPVQMAQPVTQAPSYDSSGSESSTISYGLDQPRIFKSDDGLAELSFAKDTMLFSSEGQFLNVVGIRSRSITDLPPLPANQSLHFSGYAYEIFPSGTYFNPNGHLSLILPPERAYEIINTKPIIYEYLPQTATWEPVSTTSNVFTNVITADIFEAEIFGLFTPEISKSQNVTDSGINNTSTSFVDNQTENISTLSVSSNLTTIIPVITPHVIITPQEIITPLPVQTYQSTNVSGDTEPVITPEETRTQVQTGQTGSKIPGSGSFSALVSAIKAKFTGPVLGALGIIILLILINGAVYAIYKYWWIKRDRNG